MSTPRKPGRLRDGIRGQCQSLPASELTFPFGDDVEVYKVGGKMFALVSLDDETALVTLKCDPEGAVGLRRAYASIQPGYHMNKRHWITVTLDGGVPDALMSDLVTDSHALVAASLPAKDRPGV